MNGDHNGNSEKVKAMELQVQEERLTAQQKEKKLLEKLEHETKQRLDMEEELEMKNKSLEQWEAEIARVKSTMETMQTENNTLRERSNQAQDTRFDAVANAAAGLTDTDVKEALLGELEQLRQNLTSERELRQQYSD